MFWGLVLKPGNQYKQVVESPFHISKACSKCLTASCHLVLRHQDQEYVLCHINKENGQVDLNLNFSIGEHIEFFLRQISTEIGDNTEADAEVCLSGYYISKQSTDDSMSSSVAVKRSLMNGHVEENVEENEIISIKKRSHDQVNGDDDPEFVSRSKKPKSSSKDPERESSGPTATVGELMASLSKVGGGDDDTDEDEDFNASGLDEEGEEDGEGSDDDDDDEEGGDGEEGAEDDEFDYEDIEEDELAGLQEDMNMSLSDLKVPRKSQTSSAAIDERDKPCSSSGGKKSKSKKSEQSSK